MSAGSSGVNQYTGGGKGGNSLGSLPDIEIYERLVAGLGDAVMLRPAIIGNMRKKIHARHILNIWAPMAPIFYDIDGLEINEIGHDDFDSRKVDSIELANAYRGKINLYELSSPCLAYEVEHTPYAKVKDVWVETGTTVVKSRQQIYCGVVGVPFNMVNYNVIFFDPEVKYADAFLSGLVNPIGIHMRASERWRTYRYTEMLLEHIARHYPGHVIAIDDKYSYTGRLKNIKTLSEPNIRNVWSVISRLKLLIGPDSAGVHLAGSVGTPVYGIFGPTDPKIRLVYPTSAWMPEFKVLGRRCRQYCWYTPCKGLHCLNSRFPYKIWKDVKSKYGYILFEGKKPKVAIPDLLVRKHGSEVAIALLEGLGGTVMLSDHAYKYYKKYGKRPWIIIRKYSDLFINNPYIKGILEVGDITYKTLVDDVIKDFKSVAVIKTGLGKWYNNEEDIYESNLGAYSPLYQNHPRGITVLEKENLSCIQLANKTLGLDYDTINVEVFHYEDFNGLLPDDYIVFSNGVDAAHKGVRQTKCWNDNYWFTLINKIDKPFIQVGTKFDTYINGAIDLRGQTTVGQLLKILNQAGAIVCTEGGLMHLSYAVGHRENVFCMRGPTKGNFWKYPGITYIDAEVCDPCYFDTEFWYVQCESGKHCMNTITPNKVIEVMEGVGCLV